MAPDPSAGSFFDQHAEQYHARPAGMRPIHRATASRIEKELSGQVLSIGGLWVGGDVETGAFRVTVADLSVAMLRHWSPKAGRVACDALALPFRPGQFDHVVLPLILHHLADHSVADARARVEQALREAWTMLKPGGRVWISEMCATGLVYLGQRLACPLSRVALHLLGSPLIIMHPHDFYVEVLCRVGFVDPAVEPRSAPDARPTDWVRPIIALPSLAIPRWLFPFQPTLIHARRA